MTIATGAFLNAFGILLGGLFGLARRQPLGLRTQFFFKSALGVFTIFFGLRLVWESIGGNSILILKQLIVAFLAVVIGFWIGKLLRLQKISNRLGRFAGNLITSAQKNPPGKPADGFLASSILFCAAPLGILGAVADGLDGYFYLLAVKALMDALAMAVFVKIFRWPAALAAIPVFIFLSGITTGSQFLVAHNLNSPGLADSINAVAGLISCLVPLVIFEVRRVELANFLPALAIAPLLSKIFGGN